MEQACGYTRCLKKGLVVCFCKSQAEYYCYDHSDYHDPSISLKRCKCPKLYLESHSLFLNKLRHFTKKLNADIKQLKRQKVMILKDLTARFDEVEEQMQESEKYYLKLVESLSNLSLLMADREALGSDIGTIVTSPPSEEVIDKAYELPSLSLNYVKDFTNAIISYTDPREEMVNSLGGVASSPNDSAPGYNISLDLNFLDSANRLSPQFRIHLFNRDFFMLNFHNLKQNFLEVLTAAFAQIIAHKDRLDLRSARENCEVMVRIADTAEFAKRAAKLKDVIELAMTTDNFSLETMSKQEILAALPEMLPPDSIELKVVDHYGLGPELINKYTAFFTSKLGKIRNVQKVVEQTYEFLKRNRKHLNFVVEETEWVPDKKLETFLLAQFNARQFLFRHQRVADNITASPLKQCGLTNIGNSDYIAASIQGLAHIDTFCSFLKLSLHPEHLSINCLPELLDSLMEDIKHNKQSIANKHLQQLVTAMGPPWDSREMQDARGFLFAIIEALRESHCSMAGEIFVGEKNLEFRPSSRVNAPTEQFMYLTTGKETLQDTLKKIMRPDKSDIKRLPKVIILINELFAERDINVERDAAVAVNQDTKYQLKSIICRVGANNNYGHYWATCKVDDAWWKFDDEIVSIERNLSIQNPYILMYEASSS